MPSQASADPYAGNILISPLGPILAPEQALTLLTNLPPLPPDPSAVPKHARLHHLMVVRDLHIPSQEELRLQQTVDLIIRQGLRYRDPSRATTWATIAGEQSPNVATSAAMPPSRLPPRAPAMAAAVVGAAGVGKTEGIIRTFDCCYSSQIIVHPRFPRMATSHMQAVYLSVDVPGSGRTDDLAETLMRAWDEMMARALPDYVPRFEQTLARQTRNGPRMLAEWRQVACGHFLGVLHLDEVQNFFRIDALARRRAAKASPGSFQLSLVEDQCLKWVLTLTNTWQIPLLLSGTPDGIGAMTNRLATLQRITSAGYHRFDPFPGSTDGAYKQFMKVLGRYQYTIKTLDTESILQIVFELTAGVYRLIIALWIAAHRVAFERNKDELQPEDFETAATTFLAPLGPAVKALLSGSPDAVRRYEDLKPGETFWEAFWSTMRQDLLPAPCSS